MDGFWALLYGQVRFGRHRFRTASNVKGLMIELLPLIFALMLFSSFECTLIQTNRNDSLQLNAIDTKRSAVHAGMRRGKLRLLAIRCQLLVWKYNI